MNITETAELLGVTERAVRRYTEQGRLSTRSKKVKGADGRTREVNDFNPEEVETLKRELEQPTRPPRPQVMRDNSADTALALPFNQSQALEAINAATTNLGATIAAAFSEQLAEAVQRTRPVKMLSAPEAARRAGVSVQMIRVAIKDKRLTAHKGIGGGLGKVKSSDLDDFIRNL